MRLTSLRLLDNKEYSDFTIICDDGSTKRDWKVHKAIVCRSSEYLKSAVEQTFQEGITIQSTLREDPEIMALVLQYMYGNDYIVPDSPPRVPNQTPGVRVFEWRSHRISVACVVSFITCSHT